jgi:hypothetical protein
MAHFQQVVRDAFMEGAAIGTDGWTRSVARRAAWDA